jgi:hypothetical protein
MVHGDGTDASKLNDISCGQWYPTMCSVDLDADQLKGIKT